MSKLPLAAIAVATSLFAGHAAMADIIFDPTTQSVLVGQLVESSPEVAVVDIQGFSVAPSAVGTYAILEEPAGGGPGYPWSDFINISNTGVNNWGVIVFDSTGVGGSTGATICADEGNPNASLNGVPYAVCILDVPLANSGGLDLAVVLASIAGDDPSNPNASDLFGIFVPEPASMAVLGFGLAALGVARRRRG